jgi:type III restriction enzyme
VSTAEDIHGRLDRIAAQLELRDPNYRAVETLAIRLQRHYENGGQSPFEGVVDAATGVGKTYMLAASIELLAEEGTRNFAVVTPGRTILSKTVANFTPGNPKSLLDGMDVDPVVITADNFKDASIGAAMRDPSQVKMFVFTVQALLRPTSETDRKTRKFQEGLGKAFYEHLVELDDLVVFADEHHCYYGEKFSDAVRGLHPRAIFGLTATPHKDSEGLVIFRYPLAAAIAEKYVKTPVVVGRKDDRQDEHTKLLDGIRLLEAKRRAMERYCEQTGEQMINPVMLVVAKDTEAADRYEKLLSEPHFADGKYSGHILVVHSKRSKVEESLAALETVEDPSSPVRIIISVGMLKEGWDVKNVYVIASMRTSISDVLTEQTLGRGLRLPFGQYTGWELLDTLEVLAHERYSQLLKKADVINEKFIDHQTVAVARIDAEGNEVTAFEDVPIGTKIFDAESNPDSEAMPNGTPIIESVEDRQQEAVNEAEAIEEELYPAEGTPELLIPRLRMTSVDSRFSLKDITDTEPFERLGKALGSTPSDELLRERLSAHMIDGSELKTQLVTGQAIDVIRSAGEELSFEEARDELSRRVRGLRGVPARAGEGVALKPLVQAFLEGLGEKAAPVLSAYMDRAVERFGTLIAAEKKKCETQPRFDTVVELIALKQVRAGRVETSTDRVGIFKKGVGYEGWRKSIYEQEWFDSAPERDLANLLDATGSIDFWARLQTDDLAILWTNAGQQYNPDFIAVENGDQYWLIEVKAERDRTNDVVADKRKAAQRWTNYVNTDPAVSGTWTYLLLFEGDIKTTKNDWAALKAIATA